METRNYYELLIDFDSHNPIKKWLFERKMNQMLELLTDVTYMKILEIDTVKTIHGYHYYIDINTKYKLCPSMLLFLQAVLRDDRNRCIFNFNRLLLGWTWKNSNIFFRGNEVKKCTNKV